MKHDDASALSERLRILRYAYGVSDKVNMDLSQLQYLWQLCNVPSDREELMIFIASASGSLATATAPIPAFTEHQHAHTQQNKPPHNLTTEILCAAFPENVLVSAFLDLFCSVSVNWGELGEGAYSSFQQMFRKLRQSPEAVMATSVPSLDALWRICLNVGNDSVASQAMKDLLAVYASMASMTRSHQAWADARMSPNESDRMSIDSGEDNFGSRIFQCLSEVKKDLETGTVSSERSAERCLRILNAAVCHDGNGGRSVTTSYVDALSAANSIDELDSALEALPHGMRGAACYRRVGVMAKRTNPNNHAIQGPVQFSQDSQAGKESANTSSSKQTATFRFSLDVHPLETLASVKEKVAKYCECPVTSVKPISVSGRLASVGTRAEGNDSSQMSLNVVPDDSMVDQIGILNGCEMVFVIADRQQVAPSNSGNAKKSSDSISGLNVSEIFTSGGEFADRLFETLLGVLELLPWRETEEKGHAHVDSHKLVWELLLAMPTNGGTMERVRRAAGLQKATTDEVADSMAIDTPSEKWLDLLDRSNFHHSVYVMQVVDSLLQPAPEVLSLLPKEKRDNGIEVMHHQSVLFRQAFISSRAFDAVVRWFSTPVDSRIQKQSERRMGNAVALRILKCCFFGDTQLSMSEDPVSPTPLDDAGKQLLQSLSDARGLLTSLTAMVVRDEGIPTSTISDVLQFLWLLFGSERTSEVFLSLPDGLGEAFLVTLLLWEGGPEALRASASFGSPSRIRENAHDLILKIPIIAKHALPWLVSAMDEIDVTSDATYEYFDVLRRLVEAESDEKDSSIRPSGADLQALGTAVCKKLASCRRPSNDSVLIDFSTGVLCGCLKLLRAIINNGGGDALKFGTRLLVKNLGVARWSEQGGTSSSGVFQRVSSSFRAKPWLEDATLIDFMGAIFDGFLAPGGSSSVAICCDKDSRTLGFDAVGAAARACHGPEGYAVLVGRIKRIVDSAVPHLRHRWGQNASGDEGHSRSSRNLAKYSGLRNQGCTCYMNSVLQQLFMMPELRREMCAAPLPASLRVSGGSFAKGVELVGKKISLQWESGVSYDAIVEGFNMESGMHTIRYCKVQVALVVGAGHQQVHPDEIAKMPLDLPAEFFLSEGRPGKETGVFEVVAEASAGEATGEQCRSSESENDLLRESGDEISSRHLLEEVQRTFIHLDEGSRGRCFDPRALVEACGCLKLEFDVWQQNDASEFAIKLLDRMEIALKRWSPEQFRYLDHTFGLKQTKQKVCKECGVKVSFSDLITSSRNDNGA